LSRSNRRSSYRLAEDVDTPPAFATLTESAAQLRICRSTAYRWIAEGTFPIPLVRVGRRWFVRRSDLEAFLGIDAEAPTL
jgi:excisionase family DNA binding protein